MPYEKIGYFDLFRIAFGARICKSRSWNSAKFILPPSVIAKESVRRATFVLFFQECSQNSHFVMARPANFEFRVVLVLYDAI